MGLCESNDPACPCQPERTARRHPAPHSAAASTLEAEQLRLWQEELDGAPPREGDEQEDVVVALQAEIWRECARRVTEGARARPRPVQDIRVRPRSLLLDEEVLAAATTLDWKLADFGLRARPIKGDGACQFRAVADQLWRDQELHPFARDQALSQLRRDAGRYAGFADCEGGFGAYLDRMRAAAEWGDNLTLQAIADTYRVQICMVTTYLERGFLHISPWGAGGAANQIWLGFYAEYHYTSLEPLA
ncbi:unnamed protein product [Prorocentrum cordatum]|uniref:OTU domain-containing protein n=1 Tax=Prorocentrum cordatum TaxID=2364126 RepID=A0ABN9WCB3_9DINO|nr:unnamed protein product [Polarella glacialis]